MDKETLKYIFYSSYDVRRTQPDYTILARLIAEKQIAVQKIDLSKNREVRRMVRLRKFELRLSNRILDLHDLRLQTRNRMAVIREQLIRYGVYIRGSIQHERLGEFGNAYLKSLSKGVECEKYFNGVHVDLISADREIVIECGNTNGYYMLYHLQSCREPDYESGQVEQYNVIPFSENDIPDLYTFTRGDEYDDDYFVDCIYQRGW